MNLLDRSLLAQIFVVLLSASSFILILEGFGFLTLRLLAKLFNKITRTSEPRTELAVNIFIGGLSYTLVFFALGLVGLIAKPSVLEISLLIPLAGFLLGKRWRSLGPKNVKPLLKDNRYVLLGGFVFLIITFVLWFRPITNFDGVWYHLPIPKLFLQNHTIADQGKLMLYSLQPSFDYFWNLWPLSLPISTAVAGIIINATHAFAVAIGLVFASNVARRIWKFGSVYQLLFPIVLGSTFETFRQLGGGGNDLLGLAYGLVTVFYCFNLLRQAKISWYQLTCGLLLVASLSIVKIFYAAFCVIIIAYLLIGAWPKLPNEKDLKVKLGILLFILGSIFLITCLPWVIRSYHATGNLLDPLGDPALNERIIRLEGGGTALNHWTKFIFERFYNFLLPVLFFAYTPFVLAGVLSLHSKYVRSKAVNLWLVGVLGFLGVFFATLTVNWRYLMPQAAILIFLGMVAIIQVLKSMDLFGKVAIGGLVLILIFGSLVQVIYAAPDDEGFPSINRDVYVKNFTTTNDYLRAKLENTYDYVQEISPPELTTEEKIFIGNAYQPAEMGQKTLHDLAYINNPLLEISVNKEFDNVRDTKALKKLLQDKGVRFMLTREEPSAVCKK